MAKRIQTLNDSFKYESTPLHEFHEMVLKAKVDDPLEFCPESVENNVELRNRTREFLKMVISKITSLNEKEPNILIVSHGLTIRQLIMIFFEEFGCVSKVPGLSDPNELLHWRKFRTASLNTSWCKFVIEVCGENFDVIKSVECQEIFKAEHLKDLPTATF